MLKGLFALVLPLLWGCQNEHEDEASMAVFKGTFVKDNTVAGFNVALVQVQGDQRKIFCGGTIIDNQTILTACHCVENKKRVQITVGHFDPQQAQLLEAGIGKRHPNWNMALITHDICTLKLNQKLVFSDTIFPAKLPMPTQCMEGSSVTLYGRGTTEAGKPSQLLKTKAAKLQHCGFPGMINGGETICAAALACPGDSGSGLMTPDGTVLGIVSFGLPGCNDFMKNIGSLFVPDQFVSVCRFSESFVKGAMFGDKNPSGEPAPEPEAKPPANDGGGVEGHEPPGAEPPANDGGGEGGDEPPEFEPPANVDTSLEDGSIRSSSWPWFGGAILSVLLIGVVFFCCCRYPKKTTKGSPKRGKNPRKYRR